MRTQSWWRGVSPVPTFAKRVSSRTGRSASGERSRSRPMFRLGSVNSAKRPSAAAAAPPAPRSPAVGGPTSATALLRERSPVVVVLRLLALRVAARRRCQRQRREAAGRQEVACPPSGQRVVPRQLLEHLRFRVALEFEAEARLPRSLFDHEEPAR